VCAADAAGWRHAAAHVSPPVCLQFLSFPLGITFGGLTMLVVAILEIFRRNTLGATAFGTFGESEGTGRRAQTHGAAANQLPAPPAHCVKRSVPPCCAGAFWLAVGVYGIIRTAGIFFLDSPKGQETITSLFGVAAIGFMWVSMRWRI
jgi:hypothetical protein